MEGTPGQVQQAAVTLAIYSLSLRATGFYGCTLQSLNNYIHLASNLATTKRFLLGPCFSTARKEWTLPCDFCVKRKSRASSPRLDGRVHLRCPLPSSDSFLGGSFPSAG